jgi:uncharacterized protein YdeI (YjbR/CyaY-like superfamily)
MNPPVDQSAKANAWQHEIQTLQPILLGCGLDMEVKWGKPCFSHEGRNIVLIQGFKSYFALLFFKGVLMADPHQLLIKFGENTQTARQMRFVNVEDILAQEPIIRAYIDEAIEIEKAGLTVPDQAKPAQEYPEELTISFAEMPELEAAFLALSPGRQRAYLIHFSGAKQATTRQQRIQKCIPQILAGKGMMD